MPNYVYSNLRFERWNDAAKAKFNALTERLSDNKYFSDLMQDGSLDPEEVETRSWQCEHVGPKWCYIEDLYEDEFTMNSAWCPPTDGVEWLLGELAKYDPNIVATYYYEDECPNFVGTYVYLGNEVYDGYEDDDSDILYAVEQEVEGLSEMKTEEGELTDDGWELYNDSVYEVISNLNAAFQEDALSRLYDEEKED